MIKLVLDAGHGGNDPGAVGNGLKEKNLTLKMALGVGKILTSEYDGVEVYYTRKTDVFVELAERASISNRLKADYFVSFHMNAGKGVGFETFTHQQSAAASKVFQSVVHKTIMEEIKGLGARDRGIKQANHAVTRLTNAKSLLIENLFIDSDDANILKQSFDKLIQANATGIAKGLGLKKKSVSKPTTQKGLYKLQMGAYYTKEAAEKEALRIQKLTGVKPYIKFD